MAKQKPVPKPSSSSRILWVAGGAVALVAVLIGLSLGLGRTTSTPPVAANPSADRKAMGPTTAPVTLIEYGDFL